MGIISSNTLFHWTNKDSLIGILKNEFKINYCREDFTIKGGLLLTIRVPLVSFCDIPLSESRNQMDKYGQYGIGLKKEWGIKNGLNPVLYMVSNSNLTTQYTLTLIKNFISETVNSNLDEIMDELLVYFKNHMGGKNIKEKNYEFYKEREWRYVPNNIKHKFFSKKNWENPQLKQEGLDGIEPLRLGFTPNDISYLILKEEDEIYDFVGLIQDIKGRKYTEKEVKLLTTKIITSKNIRSDF